MVKSPQEWKMAIWNVSTGFAPFVWMDTLVDLVLEYEKLYNAVDKHHNQTSGHDQCWENDIELWSTILGDVKYPPDLPCREEFMSKCAEYYKSRLES